jgi:DNA-binding transcriptional LysR family regulator
VLVGVAGHGLRLALAGVGVGLLTSFGAARLLESQLFGVPALEPWTFLAASFLLTAAARAFRDHVRINCGHPWSEEIDGAIRTLGKLARRLG